MRILLVDDSADSSSIIADWLNEFFGPVAIERAASSGQVLEAIERKRPELVLATHCAPALDGIALAGAIKARANPPAVVVIDAGSDYAFEEKCAAAGADFCVERRHLQARLLAFLQQRFSTAWAEGVAARRSSAELDVHRWQPRRAVERRVRIVLPV